MYNGQQPALVFNALIFVIWFFCSVLFCFSFFFFWLPLTLNPYGILFKCFSYFRANLCCFLILSSFNLYTIIFICHTYNIYITVCAV